MNKILNSISAYKEAKKVIPGGVNSPVRAFKSVGGTPIFFDRGKGSKITDIDNNVYIDCVSSWGPLIFGHCDSNVSSEISKAIKTGTTFGAPTLIETKIANKIVDMVPSIDKVRMVNSGTEATMSAIRLARGFTKRSLIVKFEGNYHGHGDSFLIKAGSGAMTLGKPDSLGITENIAKDTILATFNDINSIKKIFEKHHNNIAAVIIEPIAGNMGLVKSCSKFLTELREICSKNNSLLIFDEVMTGFRVSKGGAQELYNVIPDLTTLGKVIGGGLPVGAYGGKKEIMDYVAPQGPVYQAGTLSGNPLAMRAGLATLNLLNNQAFEKLEKISSKIEKGFLNSIKKLGIDATVCRVGSMMTIFFTKQNEIKSYHDAKDCNTDVYSRYFNYMLNFGIYIPPSQYECMFFSLALNQEDIDKIINSNFKALQKIKDEEYIN